MSGSAVSGRLATALGLLIAATLPLQAQLPAPPVSAPGTLHVGGYAGGVVGFNAVEGSDYDAELTEAVAALLLSGTLAAPLTWFTEVDLAARGSENWTGRQDDRTLELERLYLEYSFNDALRLRAGRFLTPVGHWNENHAEPLTWTTLRPLASYRPFAKSSTGLMVAGESALSGHDVGYAVFLAPHALSHELAEENAFLSAAGGRVVVELAPGFHLGASAVAFKGSRPEEPDEDDLGAVPESAEHEARERDSERRALAGLDLSGFLGRTELSAEGVLLSGSDVAPRERGAFVQLAHPLFRSVYGVARAEVYDPVDEVALWSGVLGVTWRPSARWTIKLDRQFTDTASSKVPAGWFFSISSLF
ncbi:MAG: hypothetical protein R3E10_14615 [Gemmatimonadota bacterium]